MVLLNINDFQTDLSDPQNPYMCYHARSGPGSNGSEGVLSRSLELELHYQMQFSNILRTLDKLFWTWLKKIKVSFQSKWDKSFS